MDWQTESQIHSLCEGWRNLPMLCVGFFWLTLFYSIPLLALTDRQTDRLTEKRIRYDRKKKDTVVCLAGARSITTGKKIQSSVCWVGGSGDYNQFFCCGGKFLFRPEKKDTVVCLAGARSLLRPEKKRYSCLSGGCAIILKIYHIHF